MLFRSDEYESELKLSRLESTKEYKQAVTEPIQAIQQEVVDLAKLYDADPRALYSAMTESDPAKRREALKQLTGNFDAVDSLALRTKAEDLQRVFARRDILTKDVNTVMQMIESQEKEEKTTKYHRIERSYGTFVRSFSLPDQVNESGVNAEFKDGMLNLHIPKSEKAKPRAIEVKVA